MNRSIFSQPVPNAQVDGAIRQVLVDLLADGRIRRQAPPAVGADCEPAPTQYQPLPTPEQVATEWQ